MTADAEALAAVLRAVAVAVLARPGAAALPPDPDRLVEERTPMLLSALERFPVLRRHAAGHLAASGADDRARALAAVLLHPDAGVVRAGLAWTRPVRDRAAERDARKIEALRKRLRTSEGRLAYARKDARDNAERLAEAREALAEKEGRVAAMTQLLAIEQRRSADPRGLAAALLHVLEQGGSAPAGGAEARDPQAPARSEDARHNGHLVAAARATRRSPEEVLVFLRDMVEPAAPPPAVTADLGLRVVPLGGHDHIGGSCLLVEAGGTRILVDAGLRPGERARPPRDIERALDGRVDAVVVTHAHNDHCGYVPRLVAERRYLRVLATPETVALMPMMWADSVKVMAAAERGHARWGTDTAALYGSRDVEEAAQNCEELAYGVTRRIGELNIELFPAGHILGAAGVVIRAGDRRVVVTGDISGFRQETVGGYALSESARSADLLVMESTCCGEEHDDREIGVGALVRAVEEVHRGGGRVLIPAFALGRAQEIALIMRRHLPEVPVRLDGMAVDLAAVFEGLDRGLRIFGGGTAVADRPAELDTFRTGVVISTSGMLNGGPAVQWARRILPEPGSAVFVSGYQDEEAPGRALLDLADRRGGFVLPANGRDVTVPVRARVEMMRLSAHADRRELLDIADEVAAREVMLVHGLPKRQERFRDTLRVRGHNPVATVPWRAG
ncbi:MBL fold metallo-hydrolase [Actinomadura graeca]|uniref:MBL fold metallo-hydrolase n=1 Tax=Actinomadura graeca TaxID=2750812 RepID=A0ABX8QSK0_9ACTN|nr:MBL fold metallo-hydrolase [Actinomadura graeca]QXJ20397.1 MBL fold metallo-hydrolase [Actinomadura graeca]